MSPTDQQTQRISPLNELQTALNRQLLRVVGTRQWMWRVMGICGLISLVHLFISNPSTLWFFQQFWKSWQAGVEFDAYAVIKAQASGFYQDLGMSHFENSAYASYGHFYKLRYRLFIPFLVATLKLEQVGVSIWLIQLATGVFFLRLLISFTYKIVQDKVSTLLFMIAFSILYPVRSALLDITGYGDFFAFFFLFCAVYYSQPLLIVLFLQLAFWNDERAVVNACYVWLWYFITAYFKDTTYRLTRQQLAVFASGAVYLLLRYWISSRVEHPIVDAAFWDEFRSTYLENSKVVGFRLWSGFLGNWALLVLALVLLGFKRQYALVALLLVILLVTVNLSFVVYDVNRALSYGYPVLFISLFILSRYLTTVELRNLLLINALTSLLAPLPNRLRLPNGYILM